MEIKVGTQHFAQWLVEQYEADVIPVTFKVTYHASGNVTISSINDKVQFIPSEIHQFPALAFEELRMHSLLEVSIADLAEWEVSLDRALFTAVETNFEELPSKIPHRYVNIVGEHYESIHITINKDGQVQQFPVKNAGDIAKFLRRKLTSEILNKYPDLRNLVDDIELDDAKLSLNRLVEAERWIGDLIIQGEITREGGEVLVYLAGIFDSIIRR